MGATVKKDVCNIRWIHRSHGSAMQCLWTGNWEHQLYSRKTRREQIQRTGLWRKILDLNSLQFLLQWDVAPTFKCGKFFALTLEQQNQNIRKRKLCPKYFKGKCDCNCKIQCQKCAAVCGCALLWRRKNFRSLHISGPTQVIHLHKCSKTWT